MSMTFQFMTYLHISIVRSAFSLGGSIALSNIIVEPNLGIHRTAF